MLHPKFAVVLPEQRSLRKICPEPMNGIGQTLRRRRVDSPGWFAASVGYGNIGPLPDLVASPRQAQEWESRNSGASDQFPSFIDLGISTAALVEKNYVLTKKLPALPRNFPPVGSSMLN
jgi:hypothetical protein